MTKTTTRAGDAHESNAEHGARRRGWILAVMCIAQAMVVLDATIVNIALPSAQRALSFGSGERQWIVTAYALAFGTLLLIGGRVADIIGRRRAVLVGLAGFGLASALGGASTSFGMLVTARAVQGVFGALLAPAALAVIATTFTETRERGRAFGVYASVSAGSAAAGLLLGGLLTEYASWRWTLLVNVAFAAAGLIGAARLLPRAASTARRIDITGTALVTLGLLSLVLGFSEAEAAGWTSPTTLGLLVSAVVLLVAFTLVERGAREPILPLALLRSGPRVAVLLVLFIGSVAIFAEFLFLTYYLQTDLGFTPLQTGLAFLPQTAGTITAAQVSGRVLPRIGARALTAGGMLFAAAGVFVLSLIGPVDHYASEVLPAVVMIGAGFGFALAPAIGLGVSGVTDAHADAASALVNAVQQIGGSVGPALFNTIAGASMLAFISAHPATGPLRAARDHAAAIHSYSIAFQIASLLLLLAAVTAAVLIRRPAPAAAAVTA